MDIQIPSLPLCISLFLITLTIYSKIRSRKTRKYPPGPWKLPLIGNIHNLAGEIPHRALHRLSGKHGPMMSLQLGELRAVVVSSADAAKQVMKTHDLNFASRPRIIVAEIISYGCTSITFGPYGDYWRQLRKICTLELLSARRVGSFRWLRERVFLDLCSRIAAAGEGAAVNLTAELYAATYALVSRAALGEDTKEHDALLPILKEVIELSAGFDVAELFPSVRMLQKMSGFRKRVMVLHREADKILEDVIRQHRSAGKKKEEHEEDLMDVLLKYQKDGLTTDNIKSVIVDMLGAGSETSATTMDWVMAEMLRNPRVLRQAQEEVREVFDKEGSVDESLISQCKYLKAIIKETLRLHPPLPLLLPRKCGEACEINGYEITAETKLIINAWAVNRDPKYWEDGDCFKPERFMDSLVDYKGNNFEYIPFGAGRRMCPGIAFGLANVELPLAMFLYHFDWKLGDEDKEMDMSENVGVTARRIKDLCVVPVIKRPLSTE